MRPTVLILLLAAAPAAPPMAPEPEPLDPLPRDREIALARSAAPAAVSSQATVLVLEGGRYEVAVEGTNGVACYVSRTHPKSLEPHCFDEEGARTILPIHAREVEMRLEGRSVAEIDAAIGQAIARGELTLPRRPVLSWMMSAEQVLYEGGRLVGAWKPHLMIYYPYMTERELGLAGQASADAAVLFEPGSATSSLVIVVPDWAAPAGSDG